MDWQIVFNLAMGVIIGFIGWFAREIWDSVKELRRDLYRIETNLPQVYVRRDELKEVRAELNVRFDKLESMMSQFFDRLNDKADK